MRDCDITLEFESKCIPFDDVKRLINFFPYADPKRIAIELLAVTGMRISELEHIFLTSFYKDSKGFVYLIWKPGKTQKGQRKELLPSWFIPELDKYIQTNQKGLKLFNFEYKALSNYINHHVRKKLGGNWNTKRPTSRGNYGGIAYIYQLKNLRHNFATLDFARNLDKWGKDMAIEFTCKRLLHSSYKMTAQNYIENFSDLNILKYKNRNMSDILKENSEQKSLTSYLPI